MKLGYTGSDDCRMRTSKWNPGGQVQKSVGVHSGMRRRVEETSGMRAGYKRRRRWPARVGGAADPCSRPLAFMAAKLVFARVRDSAEPLTPCRGLQLQGVDVTGWRIPAIIGKPAENRERPRLALKMLVMASRGGLGTIPSQRWRPR